MIELYQSEDCPNSQDVRKVLTELGLSYVAHNPRLAEGDVKNETTQAAMEAIGGEDQIPFLIDTNRERELYGSDEIVEYLRNTYA